MVAFKSNINKAFHRDMKRFVVLIILLLAFSCSNKKEEIQDALDQEISQEEFGTNVDILITKKGNAHIKISAPKVVRNYAAQPYNEFPDGMTLKVFNEEGEQESKLTANYGRLGDGSSEMIAKDSVVVVNKSGETLNTEHLIWDKEKSLIRTEGFVKIHTADEIIYGDGFESNDDFTEYTITNIHGIVKVKEGEL